MMFNTEICIQSYALRSSAGVIKHVNTILCREELEEVDRILTLWLIKPVSFHSKTLFQLECLSCYFRAIEGAHA